METSQQEKVFFKDSTVTVTQSRYICSGKTYAMRNISSVSIFKIEKSRKGAIVLLIVGILLLIPEGTRIIGLILAVLGGIWVYTIKDEYAVRISTNAGEANSLVDKDEAYIQKIVDALNDAIVQGGF